MNMMIDNNSDNTNKYDHKYNNNNIRGWSSTVGNLNEGFRVTKYVSLKKGYGFNESAVPNSTLSTVFHLYH